MRKILIFTIPALIFSISLYAQSPDQGQVTGNFQADLQYGQEDTAIGAERPPEHSLLNTYSNINYSKGNFTAGVRFEAYLNTLKGYDSKYNGVGIPYRYATYSTDEIEFTVGNFYEQFGNGLILRTYEEKMLGYDNSLDGARARLKFIPGITITGIIGKQRYYWELSPGIVRGFNGVISLNEAITKLSEKKTRVTLEGSFVSKYQSGTSPTYYLPENVGAWAGRAQISHGLFNIEGEYAYKINDPSADNFMIYKPGEALMINTSYSQKGLGILLGAKRIDNMSFRSDRNAKLMDLSINYLPAVAKNHTYSLATIYPFSTLPNGEMGFLGEVIYKFKKKTLLGGKYGTTVAINSSTTYSIDRQLVCDTLPIEELGGTMGYESDFFAIGDNLYFRDINLEINKKFSKKIKGIFTYMNLYYNKDKLEKPGGDTILAHIAIADVTYKFKSKIALRTELQHLYTEQDIGSWAMVLAEFTVPHWFFTFQDLYNYGNDVEHKRLHYPMILVKYVKGPHSVEARYGRVREGIMCVGGVCRAVPAFNGLTVTITSSF